MDSDWTDRRLRHAVKLGAEIVREDGSTKPTSVSDLSLDGCKVAGWFRIGDELTIRAERIGTMRGQVRWATSGLAGIRFIPSTER